VTAFRLNATSPPPPGADGRLYGDGFEVETLINIRAAAAGLVIAEVPSYEHPRIHGVSNLSAAKDGWRVLKVILRERLLVRADSSAAPHPVRPVPGQVAAPSLIKASTDSEGS